MKRLVILLLAIGACGDDGGPITDPHELGDCDKTWQNTVDMCEAACKKEPVQTEAGCPSRLREDIMNGFTNCTNGTFTIEGAEGMMFHGCCITNYPGHEDVALFAQCTE